MKRYLSSQSTNQSDAGPGPKGASLNDLLHRQRTKVAVQPNDVILGPGLLYNMEMRRILSLLKQTPTFKKIAARFLKGHDNLRFDVGKLSEAYASAPVAKVNSDRYRGYEVILSNSHAVIYGKRVVMDPTQLVGTMLHETLHHLFQLIKDNGELEHYPNLNRNTTIERVIDGLPRSVRPTFHGEHESMAEGFIPSLIQCMKEFDQLAGTSHSEDWYEAMAWGGSLELTSSWKSMPSPKSNRLKPILKNESRYQYYLAYKALYELSHHEELKEDMEREKKKVDWALFQKTRTKN